MKPTTPATPTNPAFNIPVALAGAALPDPEVEDEPLWPAAEVVAASAPLALDVIELEALPLCELPLIALLPPEAALEAALDAEVALALTPELAPLSTALFTAVALATTPPTSPNPE